MKVEQFWDIIDEAAVTEDPVEALDAALEPLAVKEIESFERLFNAMVDRAYRWDLWGACYLIHGDCDEDDFLYCRYGLIAQGRAVYEAALANPDSLALLGEDLDLQLEDYGDVAQRILDDKGVDDDVVDRDVPEQPAGTKFDFDDEAVMKKRFPKLWALYMGEDEDDDDGDGLDTEEIVDEDSTDARHRTRGSFGDADDE